MCSVAAFKDIIADPGVRASFLWIKDLALPDPSYIMVGLIGLTTYFSQKTMPGQAAAQGGKGMMMMMPVFIAFISLKFPAGVQLYWIATNLVTIAQQLYIARITR